MLEPLELLELLECELLEREPLSELEREPLLDELELDGLLEREPPHDGCECVGELDGRDGGGALGCGALGRGWNDRLGGGGALGGGPLGRG